MKIEYTRNPWATKQKWEPISMRGFVQAVVSSGSYDAGAIETLSSKLDKSVEFLAELLTQLDRKGLVDVPMMEALCQGNNEYKFEEGANE